MNVNLHCDDSFHSLGMIRIQGSMPSEKTAELVEERLNFFNLSLQSDIVATITDGASVMRKFGRITSPIHVTCLAHAIHLSVCDILYRQVRDKKK